MRQGTALLIAAIAALFPASLQKDPPVAPRRVVGLVEIPRLFGALGEEELRDTAVMLFHEPSDRSSAALTIRGRGDFEVREHGYEQRSGVVYERRSGWFLLRSKTRYGWLSPRDGGAFFAYPHLIEERLAYLTRDWDRALYDRPGGAVVKHVSAERDPSAGDPDWDWGHEAVRPNDISLVELREHAGEWWARVRISPSFCESAMDPPPVIADGWVPAYGKTGNPTLWFHSRGC